MAKEIKLNNVKEAVEKLGEIQKDVSLNKPTEKEINEAVDVFNAKAKQFNGKRFEIGKTEKANDILEFLIEFMDKYVYWTKNGWMGVIKMHEELKETKKNLKEGDRFSVGYQALEFLFYALSNPGGTGLKSAKAIEKVSDIYIETYEAAAEVLEAARKELEEIQFLQDKVAAMQQGFYLEKEVELEKDNNDDKKVEEKVGFAPPSVNDLINK